MADFRLDNAQWQALVEHLDKSSHRMEKVLAAGATAAAVHLDEIARGHYPPEPSKLPAGVKALRTERQRRWWWATMHAKARGEVGGREALPGWKAVYKRVDGRKTLVISGSYRRSGKLVRSLTYTTKTTNRTAEIRYGTNTVYAPYVIGDPDASESGLRQARIHQGNWSPLSWLIRDNIEVLTNTFAAASYAAFKNLMKQKG